MILTDDNFATIVKAVEYGRAIYDNLSKYIRFQMTALAAFILSYLGAAIFTILGGTPFGALTVLYINFAVQVPLAIALGFDKPSEGLMDRKPRPLTQPVLNSWQWARLAFLGLLMAISTLVVENYFDRSDPVVAATMGFVIFSLFNIIIGISSRSETQTALCEETFADRRQLKLLGLALLVTVLGTELGFMQRIFGLTHLNGWRWLVCIIFAIGLLLVDELIKVFLRGRAGHSAGPETGPTVSAAAGVGEA
jgi:Ca2+-transporting ATPase